MFDRYDIIKYPIQYDNDTVIHYLRDISTSLKIKTDLIENSGYYDYYTLGEGETCESIAYKYYGDVKKFYLVMLSSYLFNWREDLPLTQSELEYYIEDSYANPKGVHHYIDSKTGKRTTKTEGEEVIPITNEEYEYEVNESKRKIKLIKNEYSNTIDEMIKGLFNEK